MEESELTELSELRKERDLLESEIADLESQEKKAKLEQLGSIRERLERKRGELRVCLSRLDVLEKLEASEKAVDQIPMIRKEIDCLKEELAELEARKAAKLMDRVRLPMARSSKRREIQKAEDQLYEKTRLVHWAEEYRKRQVKGK